MVIGIVLVLAVFAIMLTVLTKNANTKIKYAIVEDNAYWYFQGDWYTADVIDDEIDLQSAKIVDIMSLTEEEAEELMEVAEFLGTEEE